MIFRRLFDWLFYGHVWIALGATGLAWLSLDLVYAPQTWASDHRVLAFLFLATFGVYTLHRYLSFQRAGVRPTTRRYELIKKHPKTSILLGITSVLTAGGISLTFFGAIWDSLIWALPITVFYLTPPLPGWRRLRDLPYVKVIWVAWAWTIMTHVVPVAVMGEAIDAAYQTDNRGINFMVSPGAPQHPYWTETLVRFLFTLSVAIIFDFRDIVLDRSQGVKTLANRHPKLAILLILFCSLFSFYRIYQNGFYDTPGIVSYGIAFFASAAVAIISRKISSENWYAVVVNGLLVVLPLTYFIITRLEPL